MLDSQKTDLTEVFSKDLEKKLISLVLPRNEEQLKQIVGELQHKELSYWTELYLKDLEMRVHRKAAEIQHQRTTQATSWLKRKISSIFGPQTLSNLVQAFTDLENCAEREASFQAVFKQHRQFISQSLSEITEFLECEGVPVDSELTKEFEEYVKMVVKS